MSDTPDRAKLPVWKTAGASYGFVLLNMRDFLRVAWLPFLAILAMQAIQGLPDLPVDGAGDAAPPLPGPEFLFAVAIMLVISITVQVAWHRRVILGPDGLPPGFPLSVGRREGLFLVRVAAILMLLFLILVFSLVLLAGYMRDGSPGAQIVGYGGLAVILLGDLYLACRLWLILPATAVDKETSFKQSWAVSNGAGWRVTLIWLAAVLPITAMRYAILWPGLASHSANLIFAAGILSSALGLLGYALSATALSLCYAQLGGLEDRPTA